MNAFWLCPRRLLAVRRFPFSPISRGITFKVSDIKPASIPIFDNPNVKVEGIREYFTEGCKELIQGTLLDDRNFVRTDNGFVQAVMKAYGQHHNLIIRPDDVWLAIMVQFGLYSNGNADLVRHIFVEHDDLMRLEIHGCGNLRTGNYANQTKKFTDLLSQHVKDENICKWILPKFSTTTSDDVVAGSIVLMATFKSYFQYGSNYICGIPEVTLNGNVEDWEEIHRRVDSLNKYGDYCVKWSKMLKIITSQLVQTSKGNIDIDFWSRICKENRGLCLPPSITGWLTAFCVFDEDGNWMGNAAREKRISLFPDFPRINIADIPPGYLTVELVVNSEGVEYETLMFAGHYGYEITEDRLGVAPKVAWAIALKDKVLQEDAREAAAKYARDVIEYKTAVRSFLQRETKRIPVKPVAPWSTPKLHRSAK